ncbi:MAG: DUF6106 family protein [Firmicutes bacterium]|nr:DUF6106 family protein [[Eubacterium] siraeum]MCM1487614.1 DUF6106 family protein [Bacillota bacterium]
MDHYNEQLVEKATDGKDILKRIAIGLGLLIVIVISVFAMMLFGSFMLILIPVGAAYLAYLLFTGTFTEYEYIVTNNDLDIDKIVGRRKRKRLITVKLSNVSEWGEYGGNTVAADATVIATDGRGQKDYYLTAKHDKYGKVAVIFTPIEETLVNINFAVPHSVKNRDLTAKGKAQDEKELEEERELDERLKSEAETEE